MHHRVIPAGLIGALMAGSLACDPSPSEPAPPEPWPQAEQCEGLDPWPAAWSELERDAIARIDALRAEGADCGPRGRQGPAPALVRRRTLDCAARFHAQDMVTQGYFGRFDPQGLDERDRAEAAGDSSALLRQHIAAGPPDAQVLIEQTWRPRPVPCSSLVSDDVTDIGLGYVGPVENDELSRPHWVVVLGGAMPHSTGDPTRSGGS